MVVAGNIKALMEARGLDAAKLGRAAGLNPTGIYDILSGKSQSPKIATIAKIANTLGVPVASIFETASDAELRNEFLSVIQRLPQAQRELLLRTAQAWSDEVA